jgi:hypothetical protein
MNKKIFFSFSIILTILLLPGCSIKNNITSNESKNNIEKTPKSNSESKNCADCGQDGWQKMKESCSQEILNKNDFKKCLMNFSWSHNNNETNTEDIKEGYIEMGSHESLNNPTDSSIKVFIYNQWAVDKDGNLYLDGQLG